MWEKIYSVIFQKKTSVMKSINRRFLKRALLTILIGHISILSYATTYYVSIAGNDSNNGTSTGSSWQTITKVNATIFKAGDQVLFKKGDTFYGSIIPSASGLSGNPIIYGAYGTGANPIITGFTTISSWNNEGGGIYSKVITSEGQTNMVTIDGVNTAIGRYPNSTYLTYESASTNVSITDNQLTGTPNWIGAEVAIRKNDWTLDRCLITNHSGTTITYTNLGTTSNGTAGFGYFFQNSLQTLDQLGEWYHDSGTGKFYMFFGAVSPATKTVKVATLNNLFGYIITARNYITIDGLTLTGSISDAVKAYATTGNQWATHNGWTVKNSTINFSGSRAISFMGYGDLVDNNIIDNITGTAIYLFGGSGVATNNSITNVGMIEGQSFKGYNGINVIGGNLTNDDFLIQYNSLTNIGYDGIYPINANGVLIKNNFINNAVSILNDGGGIYQYGVHTNVLITENVITNIIGNSSGCRWPDVIVEGIYLDEGSGGIVVSNNSVSNCAYAGIKLNKPKSNTITGNTVYNNGVAGIYIPNQVEGDVNILTNNLVIAKSSTQSCVRITHSTLNTIPSQLTASGNYYARPIDDDNVFYTSQPSTGLVFRTLAQWQTFSGQDVNSFKSPQSIANENDFQFVYNETRSLKTFSLIQPMIDVKGVKYNTSLTLQPYTSVVLMKDLTAAVVPDAPTSVVATAGNASASVTFVAPVGNGGSVVTGYTVTSIPAGGTDANAGSTSLNHTINGLTNGTAYTFAVKATNSVGSSLASAASNSVTPKAPAATTFTFNGPTSGNVNSASSNFTVTPNNSYTGTITVTPSGMGSAGLSPKVLTFSSSSIAQTFTITPTVAGSITLTATNNGTLINPVPITYTTNAILPDAPTSVVATSADGSVSVTFMAPTNTGGSSITGYTVTSIPAGGIDINAGSPSLAHSITGLANGTYTFTVKAINSAGSSVASVASNPVENIIIKQGEIVPTHFTTVWQGLNGLNHMNINVVSATLEDLPLSADDEIAVFSGSSCVGTSKLTQSIVPSDKSTFLTILASQNDGSGNGFIDNDTIVFKIWNSKTQNELQVNAVIYRNDISTWKTNGRYSPGATTVVEIASYQVYTQSIELLKGYNMISTYVAAQNPNVSSVTKTLLDQGNLIKMQDETGNSFENWGTFGGWINQLGSLEETEGYKIQVANNCTLQVTGRSIAMPFDISLKTGWNIISFPRTDMVNAMNVVQSLIDQNNLVKVQDEAGNSIENWGLFGGWKNGIGNFIPGKAYKVKMSADAILTFQESYPKSAIALAKSAQTEYFNSSIEGNGTDHMNINIIDLKSIGISVGDELAAFDGAVCVATAKITEANLLSGSACLVSSFSTDIQNTNGFKVGDAIQISAWSKLSGEVSKVNTEVITGQMKYEKNASVLVKMKSATIATAVINLNDIIKIDVYPNPSQGQVTVRFSEIPDANSKIEISDISGRKLISRIVSGTTEEFNLDSFTPGLYLVKTILGSSENIHKLIVNK